MQLFNNQLCKVTPVDLMPDASLPRLWIERFFHMWIGENGRMQARITKREKQLQGQLVFHVKSTG